MCSIFRFSRASMYAEPLLELSPIHILDRALSVARQTQAETQLKPQPWQHHRRYALGVGRTSGNATSGFLLCALGSWPPWLSPRLRRNQDQRLACCRQRTVPHGHNELRGLRSWCSAGRRRSRAKSRSRSTSCSCVALAHSSFCESDTAVVRVPRSWRTTHPYYAFRKPSYAKLRLRCRRSRRSPFSPEPP